MFILRIWVTRALFPDKPTPREKTALPAARTAGSGLERSMSWLSTGLPWRGAAGLAAMLATTLPTPALTAVAGASAPDENQPRIEASFTRIELALSGRIPASCQLSGGEGIDLGELSGGEQVQGRFGLDCNLPFDLGFQSSRGGLAHLTHPQGQGPFAGTLGYTLNVKVPTRISASQGGMLEASFTSDELVNRRTLSSGEAIAAGGGAFVLRTARPNGAGLLAGDYSETLTVTVASRL